VEGRSPNAAAIRLQRRGSRSIRGHTRAGRKRVSSSMQDGHQADSFGHVLPVHFSAAKRADLLLPSPLSPRPSARLFLLQAASLYGKGQTCAREPCCPLEDLHPPHHCCHSYYVKYKGESRVSQTGSGEDERQNACRFCPALPAMTSIPMVFLSGNGAKATSHKKLVRRVAL